MPKTYLLLSLVFIVTAQPIVKSDSPTLRIGANGNFKNDRFVITAIEANSPGTSMIDQNGVVASLEQGDAIVNINGTKPTSGDALATALNKSISGELKVDVLDHRTNNVKSWTINAIPTAKSRFGIARDTYLREIRSLRDDGQEAMQIVEVFQNQATNSMTVYLPVVNPEFSRADQSPIEFVSQLTRAMALFKDCVIAVPQPLWVNQQLLSEIDALIEPKYERFLNPQLSDQQRLDIARDLCFSVQKKLEESFDAWLKENGYERRVVYGAPSGISFVAKTGEVGALIELISRADMILTLLQNNEQFNPLSEKGRGILDGAIHWRRLPSNGYATAYGNYFYRLVIPKPNGRFQPQPFDPNRKFTLRDQPETEEIIFK